MNDFSFLNAFKSLISVILINTIIIYSRINKKKIIFFYHPRKLAVGIHTFYVEDLLEEFRESSVIIYGYNNVKNLEKNYFFIKSSYLKLLLGVDIFMSANLSDVVIKKSKNVYLNHHIYDSPLVNFEKEKILCRRFSKYDVVFLSSQDLIKLFNEIFAKYSPFANIRKPTLIEIGYPKFDFLYERDLKKIIDPHNTEIFIKVDVEGYELEFLNGAYQTLKALNKVLIEIEFNKKIFFYSKEDYLSNFEKRLILLRKMGFKKVFYDLWDELLPKDSNNELQIINIDDLDVKKIFERKELDKTNQYKNVNASNIFFLK